STSWSQANQFPVIKQLSCPPGAYNKVHTYEFVEPKFIKKIFNHRNESTLSFVMARSKKINRTKKQKSKRRSRSDRAGLKFSVGRIHRFLRKGKYAERISAGAPVFLTAVVEYLCSEVLELADIKFAIALDKELSTFLSNITIPNTSVLPEVHQQFFNLKMLNLVKYFELFCKL
ncbi:hypothetical protein DOY81_013047, partial [Sarcophaga bullata]